MEGLNCKQAETGVILKMSRKPIRFKAGSDLQTKVNRVALDIDETSNDDHDLIKLKIEVFREGCFESPCEEV